MDIPRFDEESEKLKLFFDVYCQSKHTNVQKQQNQIVVHPSFELCEHCREHFQYALERLAECPHDPKPKCRKCPTSCYEKSHWKALAKIMRYSAIKLGFGKMTAAIKTRLT